MDWKLFEYQSQIDGSKRIVQVVTLEAEIGTKNIYKKQKMKKLQMAKK